MHKIDYWAGLAPSMVTQVNLTYLEQRGFRHIVLIANEARDYAQERASILSLGFTCSLDVEQLIWGGNNPALNNTPIQTFAYMFKMWHDAGWAQFGTEGGREGDDKFIQQYGRFEFYNCDHCGLWRGYKFHVSADVVSWETYAWDELPFIKQGALERPLGKPQGILLGVWKWDNAMRVDDSGNPTHRNYKDLLDWSFENGVNFSHVHVWFSLNQVFDVTDPNKNSYENLGFDKIIRDLQVDYPANPLGDTPKPSQTLDDLLGPVEHTADKYEWRPKGEVAYFGGKVYYILKEEKEWKEWKP